MLASIVTPYDLLEWASSQNGDVAREFERMVAEDSERFGADFDYVVELWPLPS